MQDLRIKNDATVREGMEHLDRTAEKCLFVVDNNGMIVGSLSDGDVRRALLRGVGLDATIEGCYNSAPHVVVESENANQEAFALMKVHRIEVIPVVDEDHRMRRHVTWEDLFGSRPAEDRPALDVSVVIMAGGYGTRLEPFTKVLPKPLIPVHDKPIIEHIIDRFVDQGVNDFRLTVNYKNRIMKAYFHDREPDYSVTFVEEPQPLGTAGSLQFLKSKFVKPFFVTNCDIIINADYRQILDFHRSENHAITIVGSAVHYQIPYGTCVLNGNGTLQAINEKPSYDFLVNTGMYVVDPAMLELIPQNEKFHMTHLIENAMSQGHSIGVFPVSEGSWIDIGQWKEYQKAADRLNM